MSELDPEPEEPDEPESLLPLDPDPLLDEPEVGAGEADEEMKVGTAVARPSDPMCTT